MPSLWHYDKSVVCIYIYSHSNLLMSHLPATAVLCICCKVLSCVYSGPINREMRNLISSLKNHNEQLKVEVQRYKRRLREAVTEITKVS